MKVGVNMDQEQLKKRLMYALNTVGLKAKQISGYTGISQADISRFKNGKIMLCLSDAQKLANYFDKFFMIEL